MYVLALQKWKSQLDDLAEIQFSVMAMVLAIMPFGRTIS